MAYYKIDDVEGIGPVHARRLRKAGIKSVNSFLNKVRHRRGRRRLAAEIHLSEKLILKWANMADLYRVKGIGSEYADLLEKAGVDTVKELRKRKPEHLVEKLLEVNSRGRGRVRRMPGLKRVKSWVSQAKRMKPMVYY
jgi:predicted flap endonuclease-1-like 5' DNA nuclease